MPLSCFAPKLLFKPATCLKSATRVAMGLLVLLAFLAAPAALCAPAATVTSLTISAGSGQVTSVASGTVVTLTAKVTAGGKAVTPGQVSFCDATAKLCTDIHLLATVQLSKTGTAIYKFRPGPGKRSYKAEFLGTKNDASSASSAAALQVTQTAGPAASTTTAIAESGAWGNYTLTATVTESGATAKPTGTVSFKDTSLGNKVLATANLGAAVTGIGWPNPKSLNTSGDARSVLVGDFNGDGIPDLAMVTNQVLIYLGNADGTYTQAPVPSIQGPTAGPMVIADFNGDGIQDIAVPMYGSSSLSILLGVGDGTFAAAIETTVPGSNVDLTQIVSADFNGDGIPDLAVVDNTGSTVDILLGTGTGTFTATAANPPTTGNPQSIVTGDFNGDGKTDLAVTGLNDSISILLGKGDGTFTAGGVVHSGIYNPPIAAADFNGDGKLDLAVGVGGVPYSSESVTILTGNGNGTFNSTASGQSTASTQVTSMLVADFNQDGAADVVLTDSNGNLTAFLNNGSGSLSQSFPVLTVSPSFYLFAGVGDINGDGYPDIMAAGYYQSDLSLLLTEPTETATATASVALAGVGQHLVDASYSGDHNYDPSLSGKTSLWGVMPATATTLSLTAGGVSTNSVKPGTVVTLTAQVKAGGIALKAGQINFCDAAAPHCTDIHIVGTASVTANGTAIYKFAPGVGQHSYKAQFLEDGLGQQSGSNIVSLSVGPAPAVQYSAINSLASTGYPGSYSLTATVEGFGGSAAPTGNVSFLDSSFSDKVLATAPLGAATPGIGWLLGQAPALGSQYPLAEATADFNGDGIPDLAVLWNASQYGGGAINLTIYAGKQDGTFTAGPTIQVTGAGTPYSMLATDFNGDGKTDLVFAFDTYNGSTIFALPGLGNGSFGTPVTSTVINQGGMSLYGFIGHMAAADFNGDGFMDLALIASTSSSSSGIFIMQGNGSGSFTASSPITLPNQSPGTIAAGDFNGDGIPDLIVLDGYSGGGAILLGKGDGTFTAGQQLTGSVYPGSIATGDFNGDGKLDLAIGSNSGLTVLLGKGDGTFTISPTIAQGAGGSLAVGDFNQDGKLDLAGISNYSTTVTLFEGNGDGTFTSLAPNAIGGQIPNNPIQIVSGNFNKTGPPGLAMLNNYQATLSILQAKQTETATATVNGIAPIGAGTHNVEASYAGDSHYAKSVSTTVPLTAGMAPPVITPASGTYTTAQKVTITEAIPGGTIYYWASGTVNTGAYVQYTGPFFLTYGGTVQITAYATETGYNQSGYSSASYNLLLPAAPKPAFTPAAGSYGKQQVVTITDAAPNAVIYYTTNGTTPTQYSTLYSGPITVSTSELIAAIAEAPGYSMSGAASAQYLIGSSQSRFVYTVAGTQAVGYSGDGGPATQAVLEGPNTLARSSSGDLYIGDGYIVRKVAAGTGIISTVAGIGIQGYSGDGKSAVKAEIGYVSGLAIDKAGNLYIADETNCVVRKVAAGAGIIATAVGNGKCGTSGDNGAATSAGLDGAWGLSLDKAGNLYIGTYGSIRMVAAGSGKITTFAGTGVIGYSGDNGPAAKAQLGEPMQIVFDDAGSLYFVDESERVVRKIAAGTSTITTVAGKGPNYYPSGNDGDGGPATSATLNYPYGLAIDTAGNLYISDTNDNAVREVTAGSQIINTIAGNRSCCSFAGDGGPALSSSMYYPLGLAIDPSGNLYVTDPYYQRIREITAPGAPPTVATAKPVFSLAAGTYTAAKTLTITAPAGAEIYLTLDGSAPTTSGEGYYTPITVAGPVTVRAIALAPGHSPSAEVKAAYKVTAPASATITTVAGSGVQGMPGTGGSALQAEFGYLYGVAADSAGNLYLADPYEAVVWKLTAATHMVSAAAGTPGTPGNYVGDGGPATKALLANPGSVALNSAGDLFISDWGNDLVFKVAATTGIITRYAGGGWNYQYPAYGDGGAATSASLGAPQGLTLDSAGNLYIADGGLGRVRKVDAKTGIISSVAGATGATALGDGGLATAARLGPENLALDSAGNLYIVDRNNERIRKVDAKSGIISTVAGTGVFGFGGNGGPAASAQIGPFAIAIDSSGAIYFSNADNTIRKFVPGGVVSTIAGTGYWGFAGDGGPAAMGELCGAAGLGFDKTGSLYIADGCNYRVRKVSFAKAAAKPAF